MERNFPARSLLKYYALITFTKNVSNITYRSFFRPDFEVTTSKELSQE